MRLLAPLSATALALLTACPCNQTSKSTPTSISRLPSPQLYAEYVPADDGTFQALTQVSAAPGSKDGCLELESTARSDLGGAALDRTVVSSTAPACTCRSPTFVGGGTTPVETDGTFTVLDDTGSLSTTVPSLFVAPTVALEDQLSTPLTAIPRSSRVYLAFAPANFTELTDVAVSFTATGVADPAFSLSSAAGGGVLKDGDRWYFEVPSSAPVGAGVLQVKTLAKLQTTACTVTPVTDVLTCSVVSLVTRKAATTIQ